MNIDEKVQNYYKIIINSLNKNVTKKMYSIKIARQANTKELKTKDYSKIVNCEVLKQFIRILIENNCEHLLTDSFLEFMVTDSLNQGINDIIENPRIIYEKILSYLIDLANTPEKAISSSLRIYAKYIMDFPYIRPRVKTNNPKFDLTFCKLYMDFAKKIEQIYGINYSINEILLTCVYIIYGYCLYYKMEDYCEMLLMDLTNDPVRYFERLIINGLVKLFYNTHYVMIVDCETLANYIIEDLNNKKEANII